MGSVRKDLKDNILTIEYTQDTLKHLYSNYDNIRKLAEMGYSSYTAIYVDLKYMLKELNKKERYCIIHNLIYKDTLEEIAEDLKVTDTTILRITNKALTKLEDKKIDNIDTVLKMWES